MKTLNFKLLSITLIFTFLFVVSCSETDELTQQEINEVTALQKPRIKAPELIKPEMPEAIILELERLNKIEKSKVYAAKKAIKTIVVRENESIQAAIDLASPGDKIRVLKGNYFDEPLYIVTDNITLIAANGVYLNNTISIRAKNVTVKGFTIQSERAQIFAYNATNVKILSNTILLNPVVTVGIYLFNCQSARISNNIINAGIGIYINGFDFDENRSDNSKTIVQSNIITATGYGIYSSFNSRIKILRNELKGSSSKPSDVSGNSYGELGIVVSFTDNSIIAYNSSTNFNNGIYYYGSGGVSKNKYLQNTTFKNLEGIYLINPNGDNVTLNECQNNDNYGIYLDNAMSCLVKRNIAYFNGVCGIYAIGIDNNLVSNNTDCEDINDVSI